MSICLQVSKYGERNMAKRDWSAIHKSWQESGKSVANFCKENGISVSSFYNGFKRHGLSPGDGSKPRSRGKFVKVVLPQREIFSIVVELPNGLRIKLTELNESVLAALLSVKGA